MISVLMPVYNGESHLKEAIDSILNQTFTDFEFLIINDGSTDRSEEIILSYKDDRIRYIINEVNLGIVETLNKGLDIASRKYIVRMDADDVSMAHRFEKQVEFMESNPQIVASGSNIIKFNDDINNQKDSSNVKLHNSDLKIQSLFFSAFWHPTMIISSDILKKNNLLYTSEYKHAEDKALWIDISNYGSMANIKDALVYYRVHSDQVSTKYFTEQHGRSMSLTREALQNLGVDMSGFSDRTVGYIAYPARCFDIAELYQVETFMEEVVKVLTANPNYDAKAARSFMKDQITKTLLKSQNIGLPLLLFIYKSKFINVNDFDLKYFIKVVLKRNTKKKV